MADKLQWQDQPEEHDYPAAEDYLSLLISPADAAKLVGRLRVTPIVHRKAKDLLRAGALPVLGPDNVHVAKDLDKVRRGHRLSPVLLVRGRLTAGVPLTVADDEDADIPCRLVDL